jgi:5-methylthioadenosine/S-adenosylhomocysteine deaminase
MEASSVRRQLSRSILVILLALVAPAALSGGSKSKPTAWNAGDGVLLVGTVVTMDADRSVIEDGRVLVRNGRIVAVWSGDTVPDGISVVAASVVDPGKGTLIFPGLINLHEHPLYSALPVWTPPSSHVQADRGRPLGTEPYANRYDWNIVGVTSAPEYLRLVNNANLILTNPDALNLSAEMVKFAEIKALLGGTTAMQGAPVSAATDAMLARNVDNTNFGRDRVENRVPAISSLTGAALQGVVNRMKSGQLEAWIVHLAEGIRDGDRLPGDSTSSRAEFAQLKAKGLLSDATVVVHGVGLEAEDYAEMAAAPTLRTDGRGDGLGAKLVWSPLSNLLLYGRTANVRDAIDAGVTVSLGTDWSPSGSTNLLQELKIADTVLDGTDLRGHERRDAARDLDRWLVETVTINPARTLRWDAEVGSVEAGKVADLLIISPPHAHKRGDVPKSVYRSLIDATEANVRLVLVDGEPLAGTADLMAALKPTDHEVVSSAFVTLAVDVTKAGVPKGTQTLTTITTLLSNGLAALGGDVPPPDGGQADNTNTYSYLKTRFNGTAALSDAQFRSLVLVPFFGTANGRLNLERMAPSTLIAADDHWLLTVIEGRTNEVGLLDDPAAPYARYPANINFRAPGFVERWYSR